MSNEITFYIKKGRRYIPHSYYSNEMCDAFPKGTHLVQVYPGGSSRRFNINPAYAPMIAAGRVAEDVISKRIMEATEIRRNYKMRQTPMTPGQLAAWDNLVKEFGEDARQLEWPSARECAEEAVKAMTVEAEKLLDHPAVRRAYENFQIVAALVNETEKEGVK